jgi:predicted acylesterase/phospholipase RssA
MRALVLSGGGSKGAYQVGALKRWVFEEGADYEILTGISVGAINTTYLSQYPVGQGKQGYQALKDLWDTVTPRKVKKNWFPFCQLEALWKPSVYNSEPLQKWVRGGLDTEKVLASGKLLRIVTVSWDTGEARVISQDDSQLADWVIASSAFPVMLSPIRIDGQLWTDGGLRSVTPLGEAIRAGATEIDVIMCSDPYAKSPFASKGKGAFPSLTMRAIDIMSDEIMRADLKICGLKNDLAELDSKYRKVHIRRLLKPSVDLGDSLDFEQKNIIRMEKIGYDDACNLI